MTEKKWNYSESKIIGEAVARAQKSLEIVQGEIDSEAECGWSQAQIVSECLQEITGANEARDKSHQVQVPSERMCNVLGVSSESARALLEIGCDVGIQESAKVFGGSRLEIERVFNPFRRSSTTIEDVTCPKCKHSRAADGRCHSIGCPCDCDNSDTGRMPGEQ